MEEISIPDAFTKLKPEDVIFVISVDDKGKPSGMTAGWFMKCSASPPMISVALSKEGYTHKLIRESKEFVIAIPNKDLEKELLFFGTTHGNEVNKFKETGIKTEKAKYIKPPLIKDATMNFECKLEKEVALGDHTIFIGKVLATYLNKDKKVLLNMGKIKGERIFEEF